MNENNDKWLEEIISKTINTNKPQFDAEKFKHKFPDELEMLRSRTSKKQRLSWWRTILSDPVSSLASAAVIIFMIGLFVYFSQTNEIPMPSIETGTRNTNTSDERVVSRFSAEPPSSVTMGRMLVLRSPGSGEVQLDRNLAGEKLNRKITDDGSIQIGKDLLWYSPETKVGEYLNFRQEDALIYVSINSGREHLIGVRLRTIEDLKDVRYALLVSEKPLTLWCDIQPPTEIADMPNLEKITSFQQVEPNELTDMQPLAFMPNLEWVYIYKNLEKCTGVNDISALANLNSLKTLVLRSFQSLYGIDALGTNLQFLDLTGASNLRDINFLRNNKILKTLKLSSCPYISDISPLANLENLKYLDLFGCKFSDLSPLTNLNNISYLNICGCKVTDLKPLANLTNLYYLNLGANEKLSDISPIAGLTNLKELDLWACHGLSNIEPISHLKHLRVLNLRGGDNITDVSPLSDLQYLIKLDCLGCKRLSDISPLADLRNLARVDLTMCPGITDLMQIKPLIARETEISVDGDLRELLSAIKEQTLQEFIDESFAVIRVEILECITTEEGGKLVRAEMKGRKTTALYRDVPEKKMTLVWDNPNPRLVEFEMGRHAIVFLTDLGNGTYNIIHAQARLFTKQENEIIKARDEQDYHPEITIQ